VGKGIIKVTGVSLNQDRLELLIGRSAQLIATVLPENANVAVPSSYAETLPSSSTSATNRLSLDQFTVFVLASMFPHMRKELLRSR